MSNLRRSQSSAASGKLGTVRESAPRSTSIHGNMAFHLSARNVLQTPKPHGGLIQDFKSLYSLGSEIDFRFEVRPYLQA